jgi:hypothetical protein
MAFPRWRVGTSKNFPFVRGNYLSAIGEEGFIAIQNSERKIVGVWKKKAL